MYSMTMYGRPVVGGPAVEQSADVRVLEPRKRLPLAPKAREDELGIHPRSHQFDGHLGVILVVVSFCEKDRAHTAAAKLVHQSIRTDPSRRGVGCARAMKRFERDIDSLLNEPARRGVVARKERPHLASHLFVRSRDAADQRRPLVDRRGQRQVEELPDRQPPFGVMGLRETARDGARPPPAAGRGRSFRPRRSTPALFPQRSAPEESELDHLRICEHPRLPVR